MDTSCSEVNSPETEIVRAYVGIMLIIIVAQTVQPLAYIYPPIVLNMRASWTHKVTEFSLIFEFYIVWPRHTRLFFSGQNLPSELSEIRCITIILYGTLSRIDRGKITRMHQGSERVAGSTILSYTPLPPFSQYTSILNARLRWNALSLREARESRTNPDLRAHNSGMAGEVAVFHKKWFLRQRKETAVRRISSWRAVVEKRRHVRCATYTSF